MKHDVTPQVNKSEQEWKAQLGPQRYHILREAGTEAPFSGPLLQINDDGTYVCGACGQPLFTADAKFESHCGWPSFTRPEQQENVRLLDDNSLGMHRIEVRCKTWTADRVFRRSRVGQSSARSLQRRGPVPGNLRD